MMTLQVRRQIEKSVRRAIKRTIERLGAISITLVTVSWQAVKAATINPAKILGTEQLEQDRIHSINSSHKFDSVPSISIPCKPNVPSTNPGSNKLIAQRYVYQVIRQSALFLLLIGAVETAVFGQDNEAVIRLREYAESHPALESDVHSIDGIVAAIYESISGPVGKPREWERLRSLYHPQARSIDTRWLDSGNSARAQITSLGEWISAVQYVERLGFYESEIARKVEREGAIAHVFSTYEYRTESEGLTGRGINSIQLFHDGSRFWVMSVIWTQESEEHPLSPIYLPSENR